MSHLLLGNEAVARGLYEAGCRVVSSYPGTPSTEITEYAAKYDEIYCEWAPNEKVAAEVTAGASVGGARAFCAMKHVGLNVAADLVFTASYTGVGAGMVIGVADDPGMHSSQNEQDSRHYAIAAKLPMLEPSDSAECLLYTKLAFELSEKYDTPVILRLSTRISHSRSACELSERQDIPLKEYEKNPPKYVMLPGSARVRHTVVEKRMADLARYAEEAPVNQIFNNPGAKIGVITAGSAYLYAREALGDKASYLKLGLINPLPSCLIQEFAKGFDEIIVVEELDGIIENHCRLLGIKTSGKDLFGYEGELNQAIIRSKVLGTELPYSQLEDELPTRPPALCPGCPHRGVFYVLKKLKLNVSGDIGCYTLGFMPPLSAIDTVLCMGASVSMAHGMNKARGDEFAGKTVAVIGDSTFIHSGITGMIDIAYNNSPTTVMVLDNSITGMTGHQHNPTTGYNIKGEPAAAVDLEALGRACGFKRVRVEDPNNLPALEAAIKEELAANEPSFIIVRRPCVLLKTVKRPPAYNVDEGKCTGCRACMRAGCPAISMDGKKAQIDFTLCAGCGICAGMCKFGAISNITSPSSGN